MHSDMSTDLEYALRHGLDEFVAKRRRRARRRHVVMETLPPLRLLHQPATRGAQRSRDVRAGWAAGAQAVFFTLSVSSNQSRGSHPSEPK